MKKKKKHEVMNEEQKQEGQEMENQVEASADGRAADKAGEVPAEEKRKCPEELIAELKSQNEELKDKYMRLLAEFDNFRRRTNKERVELIQTSSAELMLALLPVLDDFGRAVNAMETSGDAAAIKEGILLVSNKLKTILGQKGLEEMKSLGEDFNAEFHDAVANAPAPAEDQKGKVMDEVEKGYYLNGRILRHAKVVVGN